MNVIKKFIATHKVFSVVIILEMVFLLLLSIKAIITPAHTLDFSMSEFQTDNYENINFINDAIVCTENKLDDLVTEESAIKREEENVYTKIARHYSPGVPTTTDLVHNPNRITINSGYMPLSSGAYNVTVSYHSDVDSDNSLQYHAGSITFGADYKIEANTIYLNDANTSASGRLWIPFASNVTALHAKLNYEGTGELELYDIHLEEQRVYRVVRLISFLIIFIFFDLICYIFFIHNFLKKEQSKTIFIIALITFISSLPFLADFQFWGHDIDFHLARIASVATELQNGQFPVRIMTEMCNGYSYPNSIYYCDIFLYIPAFLYNCMLPLRTAYQIYAILINLFTCIVAYVCFKKITNNANYGLIGSALYTLSIHRFANLFVRGAVGEYTAMAFLPLVLLGVYLIYTVEKPRWKEWLPLSLGVAGLFMCHILSVLMVVGLILLFCIFNIKNTLKLPRILAFLKAAGLCTLMCAWFIIPFLECFIGQDTLVTTHSFGHIQRTGTYLVQLLGVFPSTYGYSWNNTMERELPLTIGLSLTIGLILCLYCLLKRNEWGKESLKDYKVLTWFSIFSIMTMAFSLRCFPWDRIHAVFGDIIGSLLETIQFSWRFLSLAAVLLVAATLFALKEIQKHNEKAFKLSLYAICTALVLAVGFFYSDFSYQTEEKAYSYLDEYDLMFVSVGEYYLADTDRTQLFRSSVEITNGKATVEDFYKDGATSYLICKNSSKKDATIQVPIFNYLHYQAIDSQSGDTLPIKTGENNQIAITVPNNYEGTIQIKFVPPIYWRIAEIISLATIIGLCIYFIYTKKKRSRT